MRVLVLSAQYPDRLFPTSGIFVEEQVAALRHQGVDARVLVGREAWLGPSRPFFSLDAVRRYLWCEPRLCWRERQGVVYAEFPTIVAWRLGEGMRSLSYSAGLKRVMTPLRREFPFALLHAHTSLLDGAAAAGVKNEFAVPLVLTEHTGPFSAITRTRPMRRRVRRALRDADRIVAVSGALARMIRTAFPGLDREIDIIPNGVDENLFRIARSPRSAKSRKIIIWVGSLVAVKRPLLALLAFARIADSRPEFDLHIIGRGGLEQELRLEVERLHLKSRVRIDDYHDRPTLAAIMAQSSVLLVTSRVETFSLVTIEALSCGVPVVATRCGGPEDILVEPWLGRLSGDSCTEIAGALLELTAALPSVQPERLRAYAIRHFAMDGVAARYASVYDDVLRRSAG